MNLNLDKSALSKLSMASIILSRAPQAAVDAFNEANNEANRKAGINAYNEANRRLSQSIKDATPHEQSAYTAKAATLVINASDRLAAMTQKREQQQQGGKQKESETRKLADGERRYKFDEVTDSLAAAMRAVRAQK